MKKFLFLAMLFCSEAIAQPVTTKVPLTNMETSCTAAQFIAGNGSAASPQCGTLTTTGTSGAASLSGGVLNIPNYASGAVSSVGNATSDTTLTLAGTGSGPYTGTVTAKINLGNANTWTALQTYNNSDLAMIGSSTGKTTVISDNSSATDFTLHIPASNGVMLTTGALVTLAQGGTSANLTANNGGIFYSTGSAMALLSGTVTASQCLLSGSSSAPTWGSCTGGAAVSSVSNSDSTLTISPTTGAVVASLALGHANTWTAVQTFTNSDLALLGSSTGTTTFTSANSSASNFTLTVPAASGTIALVANANVATVSNSDGTLTISPTSGAVTASLALGHANAWTGAQTFNSVFGTVTSQSGTTYTLTAADCGTEIAFTNAAAVTVTIPAALTTGCNIAILQTTSAGQITVTGTAVSAATLHSSHSYTKTFGQWAIIGINIYTTGVAILTGDGA